MKKPIFFKMLTLPFKTAPFVSALGVIYTVIAALTPAAKTLATAWFIDTAISVVTDGGAGQSALAPIEQSVLAPIGQSALITQIGQSAILAPIMLLTALIAYDWLSPNARNLIFTRLELQLRRILRIETLDKRSRLEYRHIESSEAWELITRVCASPETKLKDAFFNFLSAFSFLVSTISIMGILMAYAWWVGLLLVVFCAPIFYLSMKSGKKQYDAEIEASKFDRRHEYLFNVLNTRDYTDERALFGYSGKLLKSYSGFFSKARDIRVNMQMKWMARSKAPAMLIGVVMTGVLFALLAPVVDGRMSPGVYIALVGAINTMTFGFSWQLSSITDSLAKANEYLKDYEKFQNLSETDGATAEPRWGVRFDSLEFRSVSFAYPGAERAILKNVSFLIENGRHYAFVGANGAGKTTITKLICGLYDNYTGEILVDGEDIRSFPQTKRKALVSCVFQDFARYQISLYDNIAIGCIGAGSQDESVARAAAAVALGGVSDALPEGLNTKLGKIYEDGTDISGGQWQRAALARAIASPAPLRILDEPTAALDPMAESAIYSQFEELSRGVTTIFISHRLASAKLADVIYVIDGGAVAETGGHEELMARGGLYAEMFESQRGWYI